jgi:hypothetical protein
VGARHARPPPHKDGRLASAALAWARRVRAPGCHGPYAAQPERRRARAAAGLSEASSMLVVFAFAGPRPYAMCMVICRRYRYAFHSSVLSNTVLVRYRHRSAAHSLHILYIIPALSCCSCTHSNHLPPLSRPFPVHPVRLRPRSFKQLPMCRYPIPRCFNRSLFIGLGKMTCLFLKCIVVR